MLATGHFCPDFKWSGYQMPRTGIRSNPNPARGSVFGGLLYSKSNHDIFKVGTKDHFKVGTVNVIALSMS